MTATTLRRQRKPILSSLNPADDSLIATFPVQDDDEVAAAVDRSRQAASWWRDQGVRGRAARLRRWRNHLWRHADQIAELIHQENGKPVDDAIVELALAVEHLRWAEHHAADVLARHTVSPGLLLANFRAEITYDPYGVVGVIGPWNYPLYALNSATAFALAAGNTVVIKPSEFTPAVATRYVDAFSAANPDAPEGILQVVTGGPDTSAALCDAADKIAFTGSTRTGRAVMARCADTLTPVVLECGGKDPAIVAGDADLKVAARAIAWGAFTNGGQTCVGVERVYVVGEVRDRFLDLLRAELDGVHPGSDGDAAYGPMTMPGQLDIVRRHVADALARGGTAIVGGNESVGERFVEPVVILDAPEDSAAVREETFGPTLTIRTVADIDEAVRLANDHTYALSAAVFSRRAGRQIADRLRAGQVTINSVIAFAGMGSVPMGGVGGSGFGRVHGADGLREFAVPRSTTTKRFSIPGFDLITLHRAGHLLPVMRKVLDLRHAR